MTRPLIEALDAICPVSVFLLPMPIAPAAPGVISEATVPKPALSGDGEEVGDRSRPGHPREGISLARQIESESPDRIRRRGLVGQDRAAIPPGPFTAGSTRSIPVTSIDSTIPAVLIVSPSGIDDSTFSSESFAVPSAPVAVPPATGTVSPVPALTTVSTPAAPGMPHSAAPVALADDDGIRPMTLPPSSADGDGLDAMVSGRSGGSGGGGGSSGGSGGGTPPDMPPQLVLASGGGWGAALKMEDGQPVPGEFVVPNGVPVGSVAYFQVGNPDPSYVITTVTWDGGTDIKGYMSGTPTSAPAKKQELLTGVATNQTSYTFVVKAEAKNYTVRADVQYANGAKGHVTVEFASVRPTTANLTVTQQGDQVNGFDIHTGLPKITIFPSIKFEASVTTNQQHGGSFMFMQLVKSTRQEWTQNGPNDTRIDVYRENNHSWPNGEDFDGILHDNGKTDNSLGYPHIYEGNEMFGWHTLPNQSMPVPIAPPAPSPAPPTTGDQPSMQALISWHRIFREDTFSMYLMYKPTNGVWVALRLVEWSWSGEMTKEDGTWRVTDPTPMTPQTTTIPTGEAAFPTWVNIASNYVDPQKNPARPLQS